MPIKNSSIRKKSARTSVKNNDEIKITNVKGKTKIPENIPHSLQYIREGIV